MRRFRKILLLTLLVISCGVIHAQNSTTPYSMYGYGILNDNATSMQRQMGGIGIAMSSGRQVNVMNPASYAAIDSLTFLYDMGADVSMLWSSESGVNEHSTGGGFDYLTMQFPLSKYVGASFGLLPYSSVGYSFGSDIAHGTKANQGSGGINELYGGVSGKIGSFYVGANIYYSFGTISNDYYATPSSGGSSLFEHILQVRDWNVTVGAQYIARLSKENKLTIGAIYQPKKSLHGNTWATIQDIATTGDTYPDTVAYSKLAKKYYQPNTFGVGLNYTHNRGSHYMLEADFNFQDWSKAKYSALVNDNAEEIFSGMDFNDRWKISVGGEYTPKLRGNYAQRITYRFGAFYTNDYLNIKHYTDATHFTANRVKEYGVTMGVGLPTLEGKTVINVGFEWKHRQASPMALVKENYFNITLGLNFNEVWFWQRKLK